MPSKNEEKVYVEDSYYHLYNRGVEKRKIFLDTQDYATFLSYLKTYLLPKDRKALQLQLADATTSYKQRQKILKIIRMNNFFGILQLLVYCLMPNHFHLLVYQKEPNGIDVLMNSLTTRYSMYFNRRYKRVGHLFQGVYKAVLVETDEQLIHLSRYIHHQAVTKQGVPLYEGDWQPCSYANYMGKVSQEWVKQEVVLDLLTSRKVPSMTGINSYKFFVEGEGKDILEFIENLTLE